MPVVCATVRSPWASAADCHKYIAGSDMREVLDCIGMIVRVEGVPIPINDRPFGQVLEQGVNDDGFRFIFTASGRVAGQNQHITGESSVEPDGRS